MTSRLIQTVLLAALGLSLGGLSASFAAESPVPLLAAGAAPPAVTPAEPGRGEIAYHVAVDGSDEKSGSEAEPFRSVNRAQEAVRRVLKEKPAKAVTVIIHPGTYRLERPITFAPADSGTAEAPVTYRAAETGRAILSGGMRIGGWKKSGNLWQAHVDQVQQGKLYFHQLFVNGRRARLAATPNKFYLRTAGPIRPLGDRQKARRDPSTKQGFRFREGDFQRWDNLDDVFIELYHSWTTSLHWIKDLDFEKRTVRFTNPSHWPVGYWEKFERYRIHNCFEALDSPGEWYLDRNLYWSTRGEGAVRFNDWSWRILKDVPKVEDVSLKRWQELGHDSHSVVADPLFTDPDAGDFQLAKDSPARKIGFESFDYRRAGLYGEPEWTALPNRIKREPLEYAPPPPSGFPLDYGFEDCEAGEMPIVAGRLMESDNCRIRATDRVAADGRKSLALVDGPSERAWLPHWAIWLKPAERGTVKMSFDYRNDERTPARFRIEFRDWSGSRWHGGPTVTVEPNGSVRAGGRELAVVAPGHWTHLAIRFSYGAGVPKRFAISVGARDGDTKTASDVPFASDQFATCTWFGISSLDNKKAAYYLDNVKMTIDDGQK